MQKCFYTESQACRVHGKKVVMLMSDVGHDREIFFELLWPNYLINAPARAAENPLKNPLFTNEPVSFMGFGCYVELKCCNVLSKSRINETDKWKLSLICLY